MNLKLFSFFIIKDKANKFNDNKIFLKTRKYLFVSILGRNLIGGCESEEGGLSRSMDDTSFLTGYFNQSSNIG